MMVASWTSMLCLAVTFTFHKGDCLTCLKGDDIVEPRYSTAVMDCPDSYVCFAQRIINGFGEEGYNLGCMASTDCHNVSTSSQCVHCCGANLCNHEACGLPGYPQDRGVICYNCQNAPQPEGRCHYVEMCTSGEECKVVGRDVLGRTMYTSSCVAKAVCGIHTPVSGIIGKRLESTVSALLTNGSGAIRSGQSERSERSHEPKCTVCCDSDLCNRNCASASSPSPIAADCSGLLKSGRSWPSGVYSMVTWQTHTQVDVFCDMDTDGGGWTVFQHRVNGSVDFYRNFSSYEDGFGSLHGEFWLGLQYLHEMTSRRNNTLRIDLLAASGRRMYDVYQGFSVGPGSDYRLNLGKRTESVNLGVSRLLSPYHDGQAFTTYDHEMDHGSLGNCAIEYHGAWWYNDCYRVI